MPFILWAEGGKKRDEEAMGGPLWSRCDDQGFCHFEDQKRWEGTSALRRASVYAALRLWKIRFDNKMITVDILTLF